MGARVHTNVQQTSCHQHHNAGDQARQVPESGALIRHRDKTHRLYMRTARNISPLQTDGVLPYCTDSRNDLAVLVIRLKPVARYRPQPLACGEQLCLTEKSTEMEIALAKKVPICSYPF